MKFPKLLNEKIKIEFNVKLWHLFISILALLFLSYIAWEVYWYSISGLAFIKWHTHIFFTALFFGTTLFSIYFFIQWIIKSASRNIIVPFISIWVGIVFTEMFLIVSGVNKDYMEERSGYYKSPFVYDSKNYYHTFHKNKIQKITATEFSYTIPYNSLGFTGEEWSIKKDSNKLRIISLGDSFTEGDGAPLDSSYPVLLNKILGNKYEVLNAGVRGSDPAFGYKNLQDRLLDYNPDIVIQAVSENDVLFDFCIRGGFERFVTDTVVRFNEPPWWEPLYAMSYTLRLFLNLFDINMKTPCGNIYNSSIIAKRNEQLKDIFDRFDKLAKEKSVKVIIMFYPTKFEVFREAYNYDFSESIKYIKKLNNVLAIDLFPCYKNYIENTRENYSNFYWNIDGHHNAKGYNLMAQCVSEEILRIVNNNVAND